MMYVYKTSRAHHVRCYMEMKFSLKEMFNNMFDKLKKVKYFQKINNKIEP